MSNTLPNPHGIEFAILGLLQQRPLHGYAIFQDISAPGGLGELWHIRQSSLYAILNRLADDNYLSFELEAQPPRPPRKVFELTPRGRARFATWVANPVSSGRQLRLEFLAKLYFAQRAGPTSARGLLEVQRQTCRKWLADKHTAQDGKVALFPSLIQDFRAGQIEAMLRWLDDCEVILLGTEP